MVGLWSGTAVPNKAFLKAFSPPLFTACAPSSGNNKSQFSHKLNTLKGNKLESELQAYG